jgi:DHA1 family bicyclomycin/chloramphenicol resistance-like MFS transporter
MGALQMGCGALATVVLSLFNNHSSLPMTIVMLSSTFLALLLIIFGRRYIQSGNRSFA